MFIKARDRCQQKMLMALHLANPKPLGPFWSLLRATSPMQPIWAYRPLWISKKNDAKCRLQQSKRSKMLCRHTGWSSSTRMGEVRGCGYESGNKKGPSGKTEDVWVRNYGKPQER